MDMKKLLIALLFGTIICSPILGQEKSKNKGSLIKWNYTSIGINAGYSHMFKPFEKEYFGHKAPSDLMQFDANIMGIYIGMQFATKNTGYDVYGYDEKIEVLGIQAGPSLRIGSEDKWRCIVNPFLGYMEYGVNDTSNNSIGSRDEYGTKETCFIGGAKIAIAYKCFAFGAFCSNVNFGISAGIDIPWTMW